MLKPILFLPGILAISFSVIGTVDFNCDDADICQGEGPLPERACCGGLGGAKCVPGHTECNVKLGYKCSEHGFCTGLFGLTVTNISITSITLSWDNFQPQGYRFEYSLFYSTTYSNDTSIWNREEHGDVSMTTVYGLQPNTMYFMRVATWQQSDIIANLTEVVVTSTTVLPFCDYNNKKYRVGQEFQIDCEDVCVCMTDGELECRPVCNDTSLLLPTAPNLVCREEMKGCCPTTVCDDKSLPPDSKVETSVALANHNTCSKYKDRGVQTWHQDCHSYCNCTEDDITCYPLCTARSEPVITRDDCRLVNQPYLCCQQWLCQPNDVHTVTLNLTLQVEGICDETDHALLSVLSEAGASLLYFHSLRECSVPGDDGVLCTIDRTYIQCPGPSLDTIQLMLSVSFHIRITSHHISLDNLVASVYNQTEHMVTSALYDGNTTFPLAAVLASHPIYTCCRGFSWNGFKCVNISESTGRLFQIYQVLERSVVLNWSLSLYNEDVTRMVVCWKQLDEETQVTQIPVNKTKTKIHITNLDPSTMYTAWMDVLVQNVTWIHFKEIHFLTTAEPLIDTRTYQNYLVGVIVAMVTVTVGVLVGVSILIIRKRWLTHKNHIPQQNAFENKIFEIRVREDGIY
ncbi:uncharacterized protein LOC132554364 [Ylistrum balloti]|uniref:uncharacterized protein LOC132554364 n=1 Tax=Ylistrum balloti TaxID=509963 RepID=UPI002905AB33|nr:uncharacterized protein LOC132554364 [Ylistrum balloti]